jgi:hypothetical protein
VDRKVEDFPGLEVVVYVSLTCVHHGVDGSLWEDCHFPRRQDGFHDSGCVLLDGVGVGFTLTICKPLNVSCMPDAHLAKGYSHLGWQGHS